MAQTDTASQRRQILELVARVERRIRLQRVFERGTAGGLFYLMVMTVVVVLFKTGWLETAGLVRAAVALLAVPVAMIGWGWFSAVDRVSVAQRIDRANGLHDRLSTALSLLEAGKDDAFVRAQIRDALRHADKVDTSRAAPFERPTDLAAFGVFLAAVGVLAVLEPPSHIHPLPKPPVIEHDPVLDEATIALERDRLQEMKDVLKKIDDPEAKELVDDIDKLLDDVEKRKVSDKEFLDRIDKIEKKFFDKEQDQASKELADKLQKAAKDLENEAKKDLEGQKEAKDVLDALKKKDLVQGRRRAVEAGGQARQKPAQRRGRQEAGRPLREICRQD